MQDELERRLGANEAIFREVNEAISRGAWPGDEDSPVGFRCECARLGCNAVVSLTPAEYERVRAHPRRFLMVPGHELDDVEAVVQDSPGYVVVEKHSVAGAEATASDPRA